MLVDVDEIGKALRCCSEYRREARSFYHSYGFQHLDFIVGSSAYYASSSPDCKWRYVHGHLDGMRDYPTLVMAIEMYF